MVESIWCGSLGMSRQTTLGLNLAFPWWPRALLKTVERANHDWQGHSPCSQMPLKQNGNVGYMWNHLCARIDNIRLRVLHPNIQEHPTVDILCGLPEDSRLSPSLFGIFVVLTSSINFKQNSPKLLLILHLVYNTMGQRKFGLVGYCTLMTSRSCPLAQAMSHVCQEWSVRNRMQISTQKTKVMAFFETSSLQKARGGQHRPGP